MSEIFFYVFMKNKDIKCYHQIYHIYKVDDNGILSPTTLNCWDFF